jgi:hypothetical protein
MDFADALRLAAGPCGAEFVTFDRDMIRAGKRLGQQITGPRTTQ